MSRSRMAVLVGAVAMVLAAFLSAGTGLAAARDVGSYNWAGYAVRGPTMGAVVLEFDVPEVTCTADDQALSIWAGFGGLVEQSLVQAGMQVRCFGTTPRYELFQQFTTGTGASTEGPLVVPGDTVRVVVCPGTSTSSAGRCAPTAGSAATYLTAVSVRPRDGGAFRVWPGSLVPRAFVNTRQEAGCIVERPRDATSDTILALPAFTPPTLRCQPYRSISPPPTKVDLASGGAGYSAYRLSIVSPLADDAIAAGGRAADRPRPGPVDPARSGVLAPPPLGAPGPSDLRLVVPSTPALPAARPASSGLDTALAHSPLARVTDPAPAPSIGENR